MADLAAQKITRDGLGPVMQAATAGGDRFPGGNTRFLKVTNGSAGAITATFDSVMPCDQGFDHNVAVSVPAGATRDIGPFARRFFDADGYVGVTYSASASVTVAAIEV